MYKIHLKPNEKTNFIDLKSYSLLLPGDMESAVFNYIATAKVVKSVFKVKSLKWKILYQQIKNGYG